MELLANTIKPYKNGGYWVFSDPRVGLSNEPFVKGTNAIINKLTEKLDKPEYGFNLTFGLGLLPSKISYRLSLIRTDDGGAWYKLDGTSLEGWLCPSMFLYFKEAPLHIFVSCNPASRGFRLKNKILSCFRKPLNVGFIP